MISQLLEQADLYLSQFAPACAAAWRGPELTPSFEIVIISEE